MFSIFCYLGEEKLNAIDSLEMEENGMEQTVIDILSCLFLRSLLHAWPMAIAKNMIYVITYREVALFYCKHCDFKPLDFVDAKSRRFAKYGIK